jgi:cytochrome b pre-mRNA-processing protein 3
MNERLCCYHDSRWYGPGRVGRTFRPRHALVTMHLWFLHKRLIADGYDKSTALGIQEELFRIMWDDTTCRIRQQGVNELLVNKNLEKVQRYTFLHLTHYDHCFTPQFLDKPYERMQELRQLIWTHLFVKDEAMEHRYDHLDRFVWYVEANVQNILLDWPDEYYRQARVRWVDLPSFDNLIEADGSPLEPQPIHPEDVLPPPWRRNITSSGIEYYWNAETLESRWERPTELTAS